MAATSRYGEEAAKNAIRLSIKELKKERARHIEHRIVAGSPADALLEAAGSDPTNLIVVGNRGLGAESGEALGSIPAVAGRTFRFKPGPRRAQATINLARKAKGTYRVKVRLTTLKGRTVRQTRVYRTCRPGPD